ncbi:ski2-like helicase [Serratia proteamaculans]|uniref:DEAD/DEAH box helicase n=1 Tax=Serratia proteamaculans TaxID=28151 RepID=UPI00217BFADD|nr:DEAD/DEAH box helicase [Serratia proteamaculans]CAI0881469.1 ski2-like helicase [Serratia proteamaculans]
MGTLEKLYLELIRSSILHLLGCFNTSEVDIGNMYKLVSYASVLSLSSEDKDVIKAYEIVSRVIEICPNVNHELISSADIIMSRIGNFPGRRLMRERFNNGLEPRVNLSLALERVARESENLCGENELTDFQYRLFSKLDENVSLSVSAPTSAGKSFVLALSAIRNIKKHAKECIVYVVPTRALITEVSLKLRSECANAGLTDVIIRTSPILVDRSKVVNGVIYVLTQERLISLLTDSYSDPSFKINLLLVDEAHEIQKGKRGIILQNAIELALELNENANIMFSSPLINNPEYFLSLFKRKNKSDYLIENVSPVAQNILLVNKLNKKVRSIYISALFDDVRVDIGEFDINFNFRGGKSEQRSSFAQFVAESGGAVIIFENRPSDAEDIAVSLANKIGAVDVGEGFSDFIDFVEAEIHADYSLIHCLRSGVAFHYGNMPSIIRNGIEHFFKSGDISFIVCTSTLLQGVNLPAKHIILENPHSGTEPMSRADFQNLAGRAGRLMKEFHGNVWCLRADDWDLKSFEGDKLQNITSAMSNVMMDGGELILNNIDGFVTDPVSKELADVAFAKLYYEFKRDNLLSEYFLTPTSHPDYNDVLEYNYEAMTKLTITVPDEILKLHRTVRPDYIQSLYDYFGAQSDLEEYVLSSPYKKGGKARVDLAIVVIKDVFNWSVSEKYAAWISMLAHKWMIGHSLNSIISFEVERKITIDDKNKSVKDPMLISRKVSSIVRGILQGLENQVRYNLVRYLKIYQEILKFKIRERGDYSLADQVENISAYLEFGSCNTIDLNLMAVGLSRSTAISLRRKVNLSYLSTPEEYINYLKGLNINKLNLPSFCVKEIQDILGD